MVHLCLGWEVSSIQEKLVFETDGTYDEPDPEKYSEVINQWWVDLFQYLAEFKGLDVFACSGNMHFFDDDEVRIIGIRVEFGWVLSHNSYDSDDHGVRSEHEDFASPQAFINDQHSKSNPIPPPKIHISEWYEHDFIHLETQVSMLLEDRQKRKERRKRREEKKKLGLCGIYDCNNAANLSIECKFCLVSIAMTTEMARRAGAKCNHSNRRRTAYSPINRGQILDPSVMSHGCRGPR